MLCEAYSVRETSGIARWLQTVSGAQVVISGEDVTAPDDSTSSTAERSPYWGLSGGQQLAVQRWDEIHMRPVTSRTFTLAIDLGVVHTYQLTVGTTPVLVAVAADTVQADVPALLAAAWALAGFGLEADGSPGGYVLLANDDTTFTVSGLAIRGGLPTFDYGYGLAQVSEVATEDTWSLQVQIVTHTYIATYWGWTRGRGIAKRACRLIEMAACRPDVVDLLLRYTGMRAAVTTLTELDRVAFGTGDMISTMDVAQLEIQVDAVTVEAEPVETLSALALLIEAGTDVPGNVLVADVDTGLVEHAPEAAEEYEP